MKITTKIVMVPWINIYIIGPVVLTSANHTFRAGPKRMERYYIGNIQRFE